MSVIAKVVAISSSKMTQFANKNRTRLILQLMEGIQKYVSFLMA